MVDFFRGFLMPAAALAFASLAPTLARAADMPAAPSFDPVEEERVTFGTGWYLRGDIGAANDIKLSVGSIPLPSTNSFINSWSAGLGFGYKYNEWFRTDVTVDFRRARSFQGNTAGPIPCQTGATPITVNGVIVGSNPVYSGCYDYSHARMSTMHVLFNGYVDLGTWSGITPYVGAGIGFSNIYQKASQNWFYGNGNAYNPTWTDPFTTGTYSAYWDQSRSTNSIQFAWAAMAGASYAFTRNVSVDVGYRYLGLGNIKTYSSFGGTTKQSVRAQEVRLGVRYTPD